MKNIKNMLAILVCCSIMALTLMLFTKAHAATVSAVSPSYEHTKSAIDNASAGDTVLIPSGNATWSSQLTITKAITLQGAGIGSTNITSGLSSGNLIEYNPSNASSDTLFRVTGFTFNGNSLGGSGIRIENYSHSVVTNIRIDHCRFHHVGGSTISTGGFVYGLADNNEFEDNHFDFNIQGWNWYSWDELPVSAGSANAFYIEDNSFSYSGSVATTFIQGGHGGKYVIRYNEINGYPSFDIFDAHGNQDPVTESYSPGGSRANMLAEIYNNTIVSGKSGTHRLLYLRGGQGIVFNNPITGTASGAQIEITEEDDWRFSFVSSPEAYDTVNNTYFFANTLGGSPITPSYQDSSDADYIVLGSEYWNPDSGLDANKSETPSLGDTYGATDTGKIYKCNTNNIWSLVYTPYTYPHPLRGETNQNNLSKPSAPSKPKVSPQ